MIRLPLNAVLWAIAILALVWIVWLVRLWSLEQQAELHTLNLLARASKQDWVAVGKMIAPDYRDAWGHGKEKALTDAEEFGQHFFSLRIGPVEPLTVQSEAGTATVSARLGVYGSGTPMAHAIIEAVHELEGPFAFRWQKSGSWPWQWTLSGLEQKELVARYQR
ncbi:MAG: hypothetical protein ACKOJB_00955 [Chthoniobacterales bacterium]